MNKIRQRPTDRILCMLRYDKNWTKETPIYSPCLPLIISTYWQIFECFNTLSFWNFPKILTEFGVKGRPLVPQVSVAWAEAKKVVIPICATPSDDECMQGISEVFSHLHFTLRGNASENLSSDNCVSGEICSRHFGMDNDRKVATLYKVAQFNI